MIALTACSCADCLEEGLRFPHDPVQLSLIDGGLDAIEPAPPLLDALTAATVSVSVPLPHRRRRTLAAATTGDVR